MKLIECVDRGNIYRSPVAEKVIAKELQARGLSDTYSAISRGVQGTTVDPEPVKFPNITYYEEKYQDSKPTLERFGIDLSSHISTPVDEEAVERASIIFAMDKKTKDALQTLFPDQVDKIHIFTELINEDRDIMDPEGVSGKETQERIITEIVEIISQGFPKLLSMV